MTQDEIIEMAKQAGSSKLISKDSVEHALTSTAKIEAFAKLIAAKEREACALIVESNADACRSDGVAQMYLYSNATAIRAKGET